MKPIHLKQRQPKLQKSCGRSESGNHFFKLHRLPPQQGDRRISITKSVQDPIIFGIHKWVRYAIKTELFTVAGLNLAFGER